MKANIQGMFGKIHWTEFSLFYMSSAHRLDWPNNIPNSQSVSQPAEHYIKRNHNQNSGREKGRESFLPKQSENPN